MGLIIIKKKLICFFSEPPSHDLEAKYKDILFVRNGAVIKLSVPIKGKPTPVCKWTKDGSEVSTGAMIASSEDITELVIKDAKRSDSGVYSLHLENKCGKKTVQIKVKVIGRPAAPEGPLGFEDIQAHSVRVSWKPPKDDGGTEILGYIVERREVTKAAWYTVDSRVVDTSVVVKGLHENVEYHFKVTAENKFGISNSLKSEQPVVPKTPICKYFLNSHYAMHLLVLINKKITNVLCMVKQACQKLQVHRQRSWMLLSPLLIWLGSNLKMMVDQRSLGTLLSIKRCHQTNGFAMKQGLLPPCTHLADLLLMQNISSG